MTFQNKNWQALVLVSLVPLQSINASADEANNAGQQTVFFHDLKVRYEFADIDGFENSADAITARLKSGFETELAPKWHFLLEGEGILSLEGANQPDGVPAGFSPVIADFQNAELNRFQISTSVIPKTQLTLGRQRVSLDDMRFVGISDFRQSDVTFDAVRAQGRWLGSLQFDVGYIWKFNRRFGVRERAGGLSSDSWLVNISFPTPVGQITGFHYDIETDLVKDAQPGQRFDASSTGIRLNGRWQHDDFGVTWEASVAQQQSQLPEIDDSLYYAMGAASARLGDVTLTARYEALEGDGTQAFQTPYGMLHIFQGDADVFLATPVDGIIDQSVRLNWRIGSWDWLRGLQFAAKYHHFEAERTNAEYGDEINLSLSGKLFNSTEWSVQYAFYDASGFGADTERLWLTVSRRF